MHEVHVVVPDDTTDGLYVFASQDDAERFAESHGWALFSEEPILHDWKHDDEEDES